MAKKNKPLKIIRMILIIFGAIILSNAFVSADMAIYCPSAFDFKTGDSQLINATIKNLGQYKGTFNIGISCNGASGWIAGDSRIQVYPNQQVNVGITMKGSSNPTNDKCNIQCNLSVYDINNPIDKGDCVYSGCIRYDPGYICTLGDNRCSNDFSNLEVCNEQGIFVSTKCDTRCEHVSGGARCKEITMNKSNYSSSIIIAVAIIIGFIILAIILSRRKRR